MIKKSYLATLTVLVALLLSQNTLATAGPCSSALTALDELNFEEKFMADNSDVIEALYSDSPVLFSPVYQSAFFEVLDAHHLSLEKFNDGVTAYSPEARLDLARLVWNQLLNMSQAAAQVNENRILKAKTLHFMADSFVGYGEFLAIQKAMFLNEQQKTAAVAQLRFQAANAGTVLSAQKIKWSRFSLVEKIKQIQVGGLTGIVCFAGFACSGHSTLQSLELSALGFASPAIYLVAHNGALKVKAAAQKPYYNFKAWWLERSAKKEVAHQ